MTVFVDPLAEHGWILRGHKVESCHMFTDSLDLEELHTLAQNIGLRRSWFQQKPGGIPHYDLTKSRRDMAVQAGATPVDFRKAVKIWRKYREDVQKMP